MRSTLALLLSFLSLFACGSDAIPAPTNATPHVATTTAPTPAADSMTSGGTTTTTGGTTTTTGGDTTTTTTPPPATLAACPGQLHSGESCPSACSQMFVDGHSMCVMACTTSNDCTVGTYTYCDTQAGSICYPSCTQKSDCTALGYNDCYNFLADSPHCI